MSVTSSEDEHWAAQIGGYNENSASYPPPPLGLHLHASASGEGVSGSELESMLEHGFDDRPQHRGAPSPGAARYQLSDRPGGYTPLSRTAASSPVSPTGPVDGHSSAAEQYRTHAKKRSGGGGAGARYGPLGPLDPGSHF